MQVTTPPGVRVLARATDVPGYGWQPALVDDPPTFGGAGVGQRRSRQAQERSGGLRGRGTPTITVTKTGCTWPMA